MAPEISTPKAPLNPFAPPLSMPGSTGGPGNTPSSESHGHPDTHPSYTDPFKAALEKELRKNDLEIMEVMIGGSGGIGGIPTSVDEAQDKEMTPVMVIKLLHDSVSKMSTDKKYEKLLEVHSKTQLSICKAQTYIATIALQHGVIVNLIMKDVKKNDFNPKAWLNYRRDKLDKLIHPNTLVVYMNIAKIDNVAAYLHFGIDRLGKLAGVIEKMGMINDEDPIKAIIESVDIRTIANGVEYDSAKKCEAALLHYKVKKAGLYKITMNDILSMLADGKSLDKNDIDKMIEMKNGDVDYRQYIDKDSEYNNPVINKNNGANSESNKPKIKDVNAEIAKLSQTVSKAINVPKSVINLDLEKLDVLIITLTAFRQTFLASQETLEL